MFVPQLRKIWIFYTQYFGIVIICIAHPILGTIQMLRNQEGWVGGAGQVITQ